MLHPQHRGKVPRGLGLLLAGQVRGQADGIAALVTGGEVRPFSRSQIDAKGTRPPIRAARV